MADAAPQGRTNAERPPKCATEVTQVLESGPVTRFAHAHAGVEQFGSRRQPASHDVCMGRHSHVAAERSCELSTVQSHVARTIGDAPPRRRVHFNRAACGDHRVEGPVPRRIASSRHPFGRVGLESGQCCQRPLLQLERATIGGSVTDSLINIRQARRRRPAYGPSRPRPRVLGTCHVARLEGDRQTHVARRLFVVTTAENEPRSRQEHASAPESHTSPALHHIERARLYECDSPASRDFLVRIVMPLVRRMVEAAHRDIRRREQELVAVHRSRVIRSGGAGLQASSSEKPARPAAAMAVAAAEAIVAFLI